MTDTLPEIWVKALEHWCLGKVGKTILGEVIFELGRNLAGKKVEDMHSPTSIFVVAYS